jgi:nitrous oxidase accessory protein
MKARFPLIIFCLLILAQPVQSKTILLKPGASIQDAIDRAEKGDTLLLQKGTYTGNDLTIRKPLTVIGLDLPVIDGQYNGNVFLIASEAVHLKGLKIINTGKSNIDDSAGMKFFDSKNCLIEDNVFFNTYFALHFSNSSNLIIRNNSLVSIAEKEYETGNGIHLWKCKDSKIENNNITGHRDGIYLEFVTHTLSQDNLVEKNKRYGLHFMFSHDNSYLRNTFRQNGAGVAVMYTRNVLMQDNIFEQNEGESSYGILLKDITDSKVTGNIFRKNSIGIYMEGSSRTIFEKNSFIQNGWALKLMASCDQNTFRQNNFTGNSFDISTNGNLVLNNLENNYWDRYEGYDLNKDKTGDIPYRPISLFSVIVEKIPGAIMLWRSFLVTLLDRMEKILPSITPENMIDPTPQMYPYDFGKKNA